MPTVPGNPSRPALPEQQAGATGGAVDATRQAALRDFRAGRPARTRCPHCRAVLLLRAAPKADGTVRLHAVCACGACDGDLALTEQAG